MPEPGRRPPPPDLITYTADFRRPARWWIAGTNGKQPRASTRYERARVASLALQDAIRAARTAPAPPPDSAAAAVHGADHDQDQAAAPTPAQRAAAFHAHQQVAMPGQLDPFAAGADDVTEPMEGRTTDPATWMRTPENLNRLAALSREADGTPPRHRRPGAERPGHRPGQPAAPAAWPRARTRSWTGLAAVTDRGDEACGGR
ncbi:hypothetical protein ACWCQW_47550 [Streptomyces mirabilis]